MLLQKNKFLFVVFKPTALGRISLYEKVGLSAILSDQEKQDWSMVKTRFRSICLAASNNNIPLLIDGEESWMQDAADQLVCEMMQEFNKDKILIYNTLQAYRWDRLGYIKGLYEYATLA